ncbi:intermembrane lipid transfer protein VPS13D isoform X1 [Stegostoma tigrinum]|uniref:intermembrane lipid transfer protein VPS13D isoform X1 n=1 Tax=Stegostoma tigrinum TaxID=3053191 RepID=UPI00286FCFC0|nr:intermembrane lipid transfer protein VPS13D isoform X1 [Stegostoma tigrinum]
MLEGLAAWVLNTYIGKYVNNLNTDQLSIALMKGAVELENLPLKKDALKELDLPFEVKAGFIGKITLQIPFYRPHVEPWVISISRLHLIGAPVKQSEFDEEMERSLDRKRKSALLDSLEAKWKSNQQQKGESYWYSATASMVTRIVENVELKVRNVHLRFEDNSTEPDHPFAFGICIKSVSVQNAEDELIEKSIRKKRLQIEDFSIYWDVDCELLGDIPPTELQEAMDYFLENRDHKYILEPVCASVLLKRNGTKEPLRSRNTPRIECDVNLKTIPLKLSQVQYQQLMTFLKEMERKERQLQLRKWRPKVPVKSNSREWWNFALNANLAEIREQRKRLNWSYLLQRARDAVFYTETYHHKLQGSLNSFEEEELERIEDEQTFEDLKILREIVYERFKKQDTLAETLHEPPSEPLGSSSCSESMHKNRSGMIQYLQSWFPGWGGWYGYSQNPEQTEQGVTVEGLTAEEQQQWSSEEDLAADEIFDTMTDTSNMNTFTRRDRVFIKLNFLLQRATVSLLKHDKDMGLDETETAFVDLEFSGVKIGVESSPRTESSLFSVQLGGLFLRDLATQGSLFPVLVSPKPEKDAASLSQTLGLRSTSEATAFRSLCKMPSVFEMVYEKNPIRSNYERRLEVSTRPLNIIYNPLVIKKVADFFYKGKVHTSGFGYQSELELRVAEAARRQYNKLKMQTKAEIRQTIDQLLVGEFIENDKRWMMKLDISAPQVIFPDDFKSPDSVLVVVDLGRILLTNIGDEPKGRGNGEFSVQDEEISDDEYKTPLATPPNTPPPEPSSDPGTKTPEFLTLGFTEEQLQQHFINNKLYEKYCLSFMDMQIMVGRVMDNWKHVQDSEVGPTHVVEKFNVLLQLERRLMYTSDPNRPGAMLSGTLPELKIHVNEDKITALHNFLLRVTASEVQQKTGEQQSLRREKIFKKMDSRGKLLDSKLSLTQSVMSLEQHTREVLVESKLLLAEFKVNYMQLGVESCGRYISVLKVFGINSNFVKRPYDSEVTLTVHGLLLVDTVQTYGSDFDLLMASHKNLSFDVPTGSLRDSGAQSPVSPHSSVATSANGTSLDKNKNTLSNTSALEEQVTASCPAQDYDVLIKLEYQFVSSDCPSMNLDSSLQVMSLQVNNLDIILNPETMVELIGFLQKSFPKGKEDASPQPSLVDPAMSFEDRESIQSTYDQNTQMAVEIHRLNILLLRTVGLASGEKLGRKIATASINGTKVNVSMGSRFEMHGSLGCLQLVDLTQDEVKNHFVVSIGNTEAYEAVSDFGFFQLVFMRPETEMNHSEALSFKFIEQSEEEFLLSLHMASLHYNHSPKILKELTLSMDELEDNFQNMLKSAASKVSTVLVNKTAEYSEMVLLFEKPRKARDSFGFELEDDVDGGMVSPQQNPVKLILNINIESPVVTIPRKPGSSELLVGHLGRTSIHNFVTGEDDSGRNRLQVEIKDIKLYSLNNNIRGCKPDASESSRPSSGATSVSSQEELHFTRQDFFNSVHKGQAFHILNDTTIQFILEKIPVESNPGLSFPVENSSDSFETTSKMKIEGKFVNPLKVMLAKHVYEQVLQTLDNLTYSEDLSKTPRGSTTATPESLNTTSTLRSPKFSDLQREWKGSGLFGQVSYPSTPVDFPIPESRSFTQIHANFCISELQVQLCGDLTLESQGLVSLTFQDFEVDFTKDHPHTLAIQITLRSLLMEDLLEKNPDSKYKHLMVSRGAPKPSSFTQKEFLSQSCPSVSNIEYPEMPRSLPAHIEEAQNVFQFYQRPTTTQRKRNMDKNIEYPMTPPPSPTLKSSKLHCTRTNFDESLVHINVLLVDKKHPEFSTHYNKVNRNVDVDFNCLDVLITLQTWVMILDFFGIGSTANNHGLKPPVEELQHQPTSSGSGAPSEAGQEEPVNTKLDLKVHSLSLVLNKKTNELAKANVSKLSAHLALIEGDFALQGSLGSLSLSDLTPHGELYRERFTTSGKEALIFNIYKYGRPDPKLKRDCDMRVSLQMASVQYVHTQRFQAEVVAFIQHFTQLQDVLGRQRAAIEGQAVRDKAQRASRILLDIEAGAPVLLIPESSKSNQLIVANLGKLKVKNQFLFARSPGTFSLRDKVEKITMVHVFFPQLNPESSPVPQDAPLYTQKTQKTSTSNPQSILSRPEKLSTGAKSSDKVDFNKPYIESGLRMRCKSQERQHDQPQHVELKESEGEHVCLLDCIVVDLQDMDIFTAVRYPRDHTGRPDSCNSDLLFPSFLVRHVDGNLLKERCWLKLQVERNLDKEISHAVPDVAIHGSLSSVHCSLDLNKYKLIRGLIQNNLGEPIEEFMRPFDLQDPSIHTVLSGEVYTNMSFLIDMMNVSLELLESKGKNMNTNSLARFDFKKSKLLYESFSNTTKSVNLVSHSMMAYDTRSTGQTVNPDTKPNVFRCILDASKSSSNQASLQMELHYRSTRDASCFTVVLNNLRVFVIFDWLMLVRDFLQTSNSPKKPESASPARDRKVGGEVLVPKTVKYGVITKRSSVPIPNEKYLEVKINVTGTEFVVVEDMSCHDTNAVILKATTVLTYKPRLVDRPFSGSLGGIEVFSCRLGSEQETALSIIDPVNVQMELIGNPTYQKSSGLLDAFGSEDFPPVLEIQFSTLDIRLSYNDVQLFLAIVKSFPKQTTVLSTVSDPDSVNASISSVPLAGSGKKETSKYQMDPVLELQLDRLQDLGFSLEDCRRALLLCKGQLNQAATWLFKNADPVSANGATLCSNGRGTGAALLVSGIEVKAESICICLIDDCMDCDVPLAELTFSRLYFLQKVGTSPEGSANFTFSGEYYNRELSGWEPFAEPWTSLLSWQQQAASRLHPPRLKLDLQAKQRLDINITSVLMEQYKRTKASWIADYCKKEEKECPRTFQWRTGMYLDPLMLGQSNPLAYLRTRSTASLTNLERQIFARGPNHFLAEGKIPKRRQPFVPYALRNHTGCTMWFATLTTTPTRVALSHSESPGFVHEESVAEPDDTHNVSQWSEVLPGEEVPFEFEAREKLRHRHTHELKIHQLLVRVNGWEQVSPVSVDKVGIFFRCAAPDRNNQSSMVGSPISKTNIIHPHVYFSALPPVRVVFSVTLEGSARKVITVRSALIVKNKLEVPMELRLDSPSAPDKPVVLPAVLPGDSLAIPLHLTSWRLQARPKGLGLFFCKTPIHWTSVAKVGEVNSSKRECHSSDCDDNCSYRYCVAVKKENYPDYLPLNLMSGNAMQVYRQPGHTIYLLPTLVLTNLLPCELSYYVKGTSIRAPLKQGKDAVLHTADTSQNIELGITLENFPVCKELLIPAGTTNYHVRMRLYDTKKRLLNLSIRIVCRAEGSLKILISAPYWLLNKTGLPLIFRQDNAKADAAGQFEEHELARSLSPLLFSFADKEQPNMCTMRIGKGIHPDAVPGWCQEFSPDGGSGVRAVKVIQHGNRPGLIYSIGIDIRKGRGRYRDTNIVTFAPRYLLDNKSSHKLAFAQREFARGQGTQNPDGYISTLPGASVVFHWPRNDYDQLLCVRLMDVTNCTWSGGFEVNKNNSFHINMRDTQGNCHLLRVEITLKGATYHIAFSNSEQLPPPFRIDNFSEVAIIFNQHGVAEPRLKTEVKPGTSLNYAWDEPVLEPSITLTVKGAGSSEITCDMNDFKESKQLYYENFVYIAATYTFSGLMESSGRPVTRSSGHKNIRFAELVLDVAPTTGRVILKKKEPGKRSQLWRMASNGMICHEGSSPPHNPNKPSSSRQSNSGLVLDITGLGAVTDCRYEPLMLKKPEQRRSNTQTWCFRDGRLSCGLTRMVVQVTKGLYDGAEVVLGPDSSFGLERVPAEQQFINQKMRPGSGILSLRVIPDGPTRVLQIADQQHRRTNRSLTGSEDCPVEIGEVRKLKNLEADQELEVLVKLDGGIGLSLVNKAPEELVFTTLTGIDVHYTQTATSQLLEVSIQDIQIDNQLLGTMQPVILSVTPNSPESETDSVETGPAVQINAMKIPSKSALTELFKHLMITVRKLTVQIEEKLLLKLLHFFGLGQLDQDVEKPDENAPEQSNEQGGTAKRYYFENLKLSMPQIKMSVFTSSKLPLELKALKGILGIRLIRFEDAVIHLDPYTRVHPYETQEFIINDILKHFKEELMSQATRILGSVDFLGNPMGLLNDVSEGVSGLIKYGNVGGLIRNVTHGVSNSAAKFAGTLSDGLGKTMDTRHQAERESIRYQAVTSGEHLVAGIQGLAHGILGGFTSVITSTVEGVKTDGGVSGFFSGLGKGLVGTVTKPVAGALDFASETAQAVRETTTVSNYRMLNQRVRRPRCCIGPHRLLPRYSEKQAEGQEQLFKVTDNIQAEFFIAVEQIDSYCVLISSKAVYFLKHGDYIDRDAIFLEVKYDDLYHCLITKDHGRAYLQLTKKAESSSSGVAIPGPSHHKPMVHVKSESLALKISQEINYAKSLYYEQQLKLQATQNQENLELDS